MHEKHFRFTQVAINTLSVFIPGYMISNKTVKTEYNSFIKTVENIQFKLHIIQSQIEKNESFYSKNISKLESELKISALKKGLTTTETKKPPFKLKFENCAKFNKLSIFSLFSNSGVLSASSISIKIDLSPKKITEINYIKQSSDLVAICLNRAEILKDITEILRHNSINPKSAGNILDIYSDTNLSYRHKGNENIFKNA